MINERRLDPLRNVGKSEDELKQLTVEYEGMKPSEEMMQAYAPFWNENLGLLKEPP